VSAGFDRRSNGLRLICPLMQKVGSESPDTRMQVLGAQSFTDLRSLPDTTRR